ncbi:MAG: bifunctional demethylmenaquinone methyltransferase/2-methoxy-6-polyprenyl-1,4-benzoquinol methylase UbiE [Thermodesulfobacteriota bacterium]
MPDTKELFNNVAKHYDKLNTIFSFGLHKIWRKKLAGKLTDESNVLDIATGTADVALEIAAMHPNSKITGLDPSSKMLDIGKTKVNKNNLSSRIKLISGVAEKIPFEEEIFDYATISFGIRNTVDYKKSLKEILRVLKKDGKLLVLEFAAPTNVVFRPVYLFYFKNIMPLVGKIVGRQKEYKYLAESTLSFPQRNEFLESMRECGFKECKFQELTLGTVILYSGRKS